MFKVSPKRSSPRGPAFGERKTSRSELQVDALENELIKQTSNSKPVRMQPRNDLEELPARVQPRQDLEELPSSIHQINNQNIQFNPNPFESKL
jgi:hypothetical protein